MVLFAFGRGFANFAHGRDREPWEIYAAIAKALPLIASFGSSGNVALDDGDVSQIQSVLESVTKKQWAVISAEQLGEALTALAALPEPPHTLDARPTPGLAFAITSPRDGEVTSTKRVVLHRISDNVVAARKLDPLDERGRLARNRRGGWGGVTEDIEDQVGGRWTSRSRKTIDGLWNRVAGARSQTRAYGA